MIFEFMLFISLFLLFYVYFGYPLLVYMLARWMNREVRKGSYEPCVTILIAAHNEEQSIESTIQNKLELNYPEQKVEVIVISDGSTDKTDELVKKYEPYGVKLLRQEPRRGKTAAINMGVEEAKGEILVFSDANSIYEPEALHALMRNFHDPEVGYVTGKMIYTEQDGTAVGEGCSTFMKYENCLRKLETRVGSIVGVDGAIDAVRRDLYQPMKSDQLPDLVLPLKVVQQGFRVVYEPEAVLKEASLKASSDEYQMRVRVSLRAFWAISDMRRLLSFRKNALFAWQLWSHKVLRYLCFLFLFGAYFADIFLCLDDKAYRYGLVLQVMALLGAMISPVFEKRKCSSKILYLLNYFFLLNLAAADAFIRFVLRRKQVIWTPRKGWESPAKCNSSREIKL